MTREDIIILLRRINVHRDALRPTAWDGYVDVFEKFAAEVIKEHKRQELRSLWYWIPGIILICVTAYIGWGKL